MNINRQEHTCRETLDVVLTSTGFAHAILVDSENLGFDVWEDDDDNNDELSQPTSAVDFDLSALYSSLALEHRLRTPAAAAGLYRRATDTRLGVVSSFSKIACKCAVHEDCSMLITIPSEAARWRIISDGHRWINKADALSRDDHLEAAYECKLAHGMKPRLNVPKSEREPRLENKCMYVLDSLPVLADQIEGCIPFLWPPKSGRLLRSRGLAPLDFSQCFWLRDWSHPPRSPMPILG